MRRASEKDIVMWIKLCALTFCLFASQKSLAHGLGQSYIFFSFDDTKVSGRYEITISDLNQALSLELATDKSVTREDIEPHFGAIRQYYLARTSIDIATGLAFDRFELSTYDPAQYLVLPFEFNNLPESPQYIDIRYEILFAKNPDHRGFVVVEHDWRTGTFGDETNIALAFSPGDPVKTLDLTSSTVFSGFIEMLKLGIHHIWEGIDHVLFLLALLLPSVVYRERKKWRPNESFSASLIYVIKIVTVFTVAHTITLSAATLNIVSLPSRLVESIIAISIAFAALDILYPVFRNKIWITVFVFGLFHGFGFASVMQDYSVPDSYITFALLGFNIGVELGQIVIILVVFPLLFLLRKTRLYEQLVLKVGAILLIIVSLYWFIERGFLIDLPAGELLKWGLALIGIEWP